MSIRLLDAEGAKQFLLLINSDGEFRLVSRDMTLNLCLEVGSERRLINIWNGKFKKIGRFVALSEPIDVTIKGASNFGSCSFRLCPHQNSRICTPEYVSRNAKFPEIASSTSPTLPRSTA